MKIVKFPKALADLVELAEHIAEDDPLVADRFFDAFEDSLELLRNTPKIGIVRYQSERSSVRMWFVKGFEKCLILYSETSDEVLVLRVIHSARDINKFFEMD